MPPQRFAYFQGEVVPFDQAKIGVMTHGFNYGTACFEGIRGYWNPDEGQLYLFQLRAHLERLAQSSRVLRMALGPSVEQLEAIALEVIRRNGFREDCYLRPLAYLADELIGVRLHDLRTELTMFAVPMPGPAVPRGVRVAVSSWRRVDDTAIPARAKITGAYVNSAFAKTEAHLNGFDDAIFLNQDGHVSEGSGMNLFLVRSGQLITPGIEQNILEGITRQAVISLAREELGLAVVERPVDRTELYVADEILLCGTGAQIAPVIDIDHRPVGGHGEIGPLGRQIVEAYARAVRGQQARWRSWLTPVY